MSINTHAFHERLVWDHLWLHRIWMLCILTAGINKADALFASAEIIYIHREPEPETDRAAGLPVQSVESVGFVVVSPLMVTHVDGDRRMESWEDVMRAWKRERERAEKNEKSQSFKKEISKAPALQ